MVSVVGTEVSTILDTELPGQLSSDLNLHTSPVVADP